MPETLSAGRATRSAGDALRTASGRSALFERVYAVVAHIPYGHVTTYGAIARALGAPRAARSVGWALSVAPVEAGLPCHRVVDRNGYLSGGWHWGHPDVMAALLAAENVPFLEPYRVDLATCLWLPAEPEDSLSTARSWPD
jgi:methylated-DNA-protein-cysteine methyltransferase related protein